MDDTNTPTHVLKESFGRLIFRDCFVISEFNEGVHVDSLIVDQLIAALRSRYGDRKFGYISNRVRHYSVDIIQIKRCISSMNMVAAAIVAPQSPVVALEVNFYQSNVHSFFTLAEATHWIKTQVA